MPLRNRNRLTTNSVLLQGPDKNGAASRTVGTGALASSCDKYHGSSNPRLCLSHDVGFWSVPECRVFICPSMQGFHPSLDVGHDLPQQPSFSSLLNEEQGMLTRNRNMLWYLKKPYVGLSHDVGLNSLQQPPFWSSA